FLPYTIMLLAQKNPGPDPSEINEAIRLFFSGLTDLDYEPSYNDHTYFQYLSNSKDDITLLDAYHSEKIFDKYIIR
ncbi:13306_t:CDS:1, partial [Racocetra persica]